MARIVVHLAAMRPGIPTPPGAIAERNRRVSAALAVADDVSRIVLPMADYLSGVVAPMMVPAPPQFGKGSAEANVVTAIATACEDQLRGLESFLREPPEFHERSGIGPIVALFEYALALAAARYSVHCHGFADGTQGKVSFSTELDADVLRGETGYPKDDSRRVRRATVRLLMPLADYELSDYLASLYIVFHELYVHAFQAWLAPGARGVYGELCPLAEGFVDALAAKVLLMELRVGAPGMPLCSAAYVDDIARETEHAHLQRSAVRAQQAASRRARTEVEQAAMEVRRYGKDVFVRLERFWNAEREPRNCDKLEALTLSLNALHLSAAERRHLIDQINEAVTAFSKAIQSPRHIRRLAALTGFAATGDESELRKAFDLTSG